MRTLPSAPYVCALPNSEELVESAGSCVGAAPDYKCDTMNESPGPSAPYICALPHCEELAGSACCTGATPHYMCDSCFCGYASTQFELVGAFERERSSNDIVSARGELPCFLFLTNECDCASIPKTTLARVLSTDPIALEAYESAKRRLIRAQRDQDIAETDAAQAQREQQATPVECLREVVVDALSRGGYVACPECSQHGQKNDACMHMTCPCGTRFCYCCGRRSGDRSRHCPRDGSGCDRPSAYLENHPGWGDFRLNDESAGRGALHEFHRRRMAYLLRQVKTNHPPGLWEQLRRDYPDILDGKPTDGRCIRWDEIDTATPPLFGSTTVDQLEWETEGVRAGVEANREQRQEQAPNVHAGRGVLDFAIHEHPFVAMWIVGFILAIILLTARFSSDSEVLRIIDNLLIAILIGTGLPTVAMFAVDKLAASHQGCIREVQCFRGRNQELPYLATEGRWSHWREFYWYLFFGGIALAAVCLANKDVQSFKVFGVTLLTAVLLFYCTITVLVNCDELPELQPLRSQFDHSMIRLCVYGLILSIGVGMLAVYDLASNAGITGKVFFSVGCAGALAEILPRVHQVWQGGRPFTRTPDQERLVVSYVLCLGVAVGSLMVGISDSEKVRLGGTIVLVIAIVASFVSFCCFV